MGCDIHLVPEVKKHSFWQHAWLCDGSTYYKNNRKHPPLDHANYFGWDGRSYSLFGILAGVRGDLKPISGPRGTPNDADPATDMLLKNEDYHSHSWLTLAELQAYPWKDLDPAYGSWESVETWLQRLAELDPDPNNVRIVFAFDN